MKMVPVITLIFLMMVLIPKFSWGDPPIVDQLRKGDFPLGLVYEEGLSQKAVENIIGPSPSKQWKDNAKWSPHVQVFSTKESFDVVKSVFEKRDIKLSERNRDEELKKIEEANKKFETMKKIDPTLHKIENAPPNPFQIFGYRYASGPTEDGWLVILTSHQFDPFEKKWMEKTTITFFHTGKPPKELGK